MSKVFKLENKKTKKIENIKKENILEKLYSLDYTLPTKLKKNELEKEKKDISKINNFTPLYDIYTENLYLIPPELLYDCVFKYFYRFPTNKFLNMIIENKNKHEKNIQKLKDEHEDIEKINLIKRKIKKINYMIEFLNNFDLDVLLSTYISSLYNTEKLGKNITLFKRPSFTSYFKHINPYYTKDEIVNLALNNKLLKEDKVNSLINEDYKELCKKVRQNDIKKTNLIQHYNHITIYNEIGLIQYYSLTGFSILNFYLRNENAPQNDYFDNIIYTITKLIKNSPNFDEDYYVYRFVNDDKFLKDLKINDIFIEKGFLSTTRNPFYKENINNNTFGWNLLKIKIPKSIHALCVETVSFFPKEEEIILPPNTKLKLISKDDNTKYYHIDKQVEEKIQTKYEFEVMPYENYEIIKNTNCTSPILVNFEEIDFPNFYSTTERILQFKEKYTNYYNQFYIKLGVQKFLMTLEEYNSLGVYKKYFANITNHGYYFYCIFKNYIIFSIEIGEDIIYVNYNVKQSPVSELKEYNKEDFIKFLNLLGKYFGINKIIIYADYISCDCHKIIDNSIINEYQNIGGTYCKDIYDYIKFKTKYYNDNPNIISAFNYNLLDNLKNIKIKDILKKKIHNTDNILYVIYEHTYKGDDNIRDFYLWLVETNCNYLNEFIKQLTNYYPLDNPFLYDYYIYYIDKSKIDEELKNKIKFKNIVFDRYSTFDDLKRRLDKENNIRNYVRRTYNDNVIDT